jgi:hypothetical protein
MYLYRTIVAVAEHDPVRREAKGIPVGMEVRMSVQSVSAVDHPGESGARSGGDHPEGGSWGYVRVVRAGRRREGARSRRPGGSSEVKECPGDGDMSVEDRGGAGLGSGVRECVAKA